MRPVIMRLAACCLLVLGYAGSAAAGGPVLRGSQAFEVGSPGYRDWSGFYVGGQAAYSNTNVDFNGGVSDLVANVLRVTTVESEFAPSHWANLPARDITRPNYGAFIGYNAQVEDVYLGIEVNYNWMSLSASSGDTIARQVQTSDGYLNQVTVSGTANLHLTDYGTLRARAGWAHNSFLPYGFLGVAVGRASVTRMASVTLTATDADPLNPPVLPNIAFATSQTDARNGIVVFGWTAGIGVDWALGSHLFLRGEYEYVAFPNIEGLIVPINTGRVGVGIRF
jgi:outer membrane immunogenic protein